MSLIVHAIAPEVIAETVAAKLAQFERHRLTDHAELTQVKQEYAACIASGQPSRWKGNPVPDEARARADIDATYARFVKEEREHYARVRVVEKVGNPQKGVQFFLIYGDAPNEGPGGTGGFDTFEKAQTWFTNQGR
jgi:hypothetical protein